HRNFRDFIRRLEVKTNRTIARFDSLVAALGDRVAYFAQAGCVASDISFTEICFERASKGELDDLLQATLAGQTTSASDIRKWQTAVFVALFRLYKQHGFVTQVHFGALRNNQTDLFKRQGAAVGVDTIGYQMTLALLLIQLG
ncbi:glucuronate isomerase, partial [Lactobacillus johnsonii]|uniref:glucuronate isomerase n=1 Tax=Lactobacillus johnsonii TaxID=33959 RepID=UPI0011002699